METNRHYFLVGVFVLATMIGVLVFTIWLTSSDKGDFALYRIRFAESVSGLSIGGPVKFRGVDVGSVQSIGIDPLDTRLIQVVIKIQKATPIKTDTYASLKLQGITGAVFIELEGGSAEAMLLPNNNKNGVIFEIKAKSSPLNAIIDRVPELLDHITKGVDQINKVVSDENVAAMSDILKQTESVTASLAEDAKLFKPLLQNANATASDFHDITHNSKTNIEDTAANLDRASLQLNSLMGDLKKTSRHVSGFTEDLDEDPSRLIFPSSPKGVPAP